MHTSRVGSLTIVALMSILLRPGARAKGNEEVATTTGGLLPLCSAYQARMLTYESEFTGRQKREKEKSGEKEMERECEK